MPSNMIGLSPSGQDKYGLAQAMLQQSMQPEPIRTHLQGIGKLAQALSASHRMSQLDDERQGNLDRITAALSGPDGLNSPELATALADMGDFGSAIQLGIANRNFSLEQAEADREKAIQDATMALIGGGGGIDNPFAALAAAGGDLGPAATAWENSPGVYGDPGQVPMNQFDPNVDNSVPSGSAPTLIPPDQPAPTATAQDVFNKAVELYGEEAVTQWTRIYGIPGQDGVETMDWLRGGLEFARNNGLDPQGISVLQEMANGQANGDPVDLVGAGYGQPPAQPSSPPAQPPSQSGLTPPPGAMFDRGTREPIISEINGRPHWTMQDGSFVPMETRPYGGVEGMAGENARILLEGDPASPEYAFAYAQEFQTPRYVQTDQGLVPIMNPVPPGIQPPVNPIQPIQEGIPGQPTVGAVLPGTERLTDGERRAASFANRIDAANQILAQIERDPEFGSLLVQGEAAGFLPYGNVFTPEQMQQYEQAQRDFVNAVLRRESGAVISDSEFENAAHQYFPQIGDTAVVIRQKWEARQRALENMIAESGVAYDRLFGGEAPTDAPIQYERGPDGVLRQVQ